MPQKASAPPSACRATSTLPPRRWVAARTASGSESPSTTPFWAALCAGPSIFTTTGKPSSAAASAASSGDDARRRGASGHAVALEDERGLELRRARPRRAGRRARPPRRQVPARVRGRRPAAAASARIASRGPRRSATSCSSAYSATSGPGVDRRAPSSPRGRSPCRRSTSASAFTIMKHHSCSSSPRNCDRSTCARRMS